MNTKLSATAFVHWHWTFPPERKLLFTNKKTPCANQIEDRPNSAIVTWKRSWLLHKYNWRALWQLIIQGKKVHAHPANKKEKNYPTAFRRKFYASFTNVSREHTGHTSLQTKKVHAHPTLREKNCLRHWPSVTRFTPALQRQANNTPPLVTENKKAPSQPHQQKTKRSAGKR